MSGGFEAGGWSGRVGLEIVKGPSRSSRLIGSPFFNVKIILNFSRLLSPWPSRHNLEICFAAQTQQHPPPRCQNRNSAMDSNTVAGVALVSAFVYLMLGVVLHEFFGFPWVLRNKRWRPREEPTMQFASYTRHCISLHISSGHSPTYVLSSQQLSRSSQQLSSASAANRVTPAADCRVPKRGSTIIPPTWKRQTRAMASLLSLRHTMNRWRWGLLGRLQILVPGARRLLLDKKGIRLTGLLAQLRTSLTRFLNRWASVTESGARQRPGIIRVRHIAVDAPDERWKNIIMF